MTAAAFILRMFAKRLFSRLSQTFNDCLILQRRKCPLSGMEIEGIQSCGELGIKSEPAVQLAHGTPGRGVRKIELCKFAQVDASRMFLFGMFKFHLSAVIRLKNYPVVMR